MTKRIRTKRQAAKLRPTATERARHSKYREGDIVFYKGITWCNCAIFRRYDTKPCRTALLWAVRDDGSMGGMFSGVLSEAVDPR